MTDLEELLRETYAARAGSVSPVLDGRSIARRRRRRDALNGGAAALLLVALAGGLLTLHSSPDRLRQVPQATARPLAALTQQVTYGGIAVDVPDSFLVTDDSSCRNEHGDRVVLPAESNDLLDCRGESEALRATRTVLQLAPAEAYLGRALAGFATHSETVNGARVLVGEGPAQTNGPRGGTATYTAIVFLDRSIIVTATGPDPALADRLARTAHLVGADERGCLQQVDMVRPFGDARPGAAVHVVPDQPVSAVVCHYAGLALTFSRELDARAAQVLLDHTPVGRGQTDARLRGCSASEDNGDVVRFAYADQPTLEVFVHPQGCGTVAYVSNGNQVHQVTPALRALLAG